MSEGAGRVAVITGGASGFGLALAGFCAARGMGVALLDREGERAEREAATLAERHGVAALGWQTDVARQASVEAAASAVAGQLGRADWVISNVGVQLFGAVERITDAEWQWVLDVNVIGSARVARTFLPLLRRAPEARLAFTASSSVLAPSSRMAAYQASKFAVWGLAETLRLELADEGIEVTLIFPAGMASRHLETSTAAQPEAIRRPIGEEEDFAAMAAANPAMVREVASPEEAARRAADALFAGERYVVTHGDPLEAVVSRGEALRRAAEAARDGR